MRIAPTGILAERHRRVRESFDHLGIDGLIVTHAPNIFYLSNHDGSSGIFLLTLEDAHLLLDFRYIESAQARQASEGACPNLRIRQVTGSYDEALITSLTTLGLARVGFEATSISVARHTWLCRALESHRLKVELRATERVIEQERAIKDAHEVSRIRDSASRIVTVMDETVRAIHVGITEREVAAIIESAMRRTGYDRVAFDTIVASGPNGAFPHYRAGDRQIHRGDLVVLDFGGVLDGYCCDLTRTVSIGPPGSDAARAYRAVWEAHQEAIRAIRPGILASDVDAAARSVMVRHGLGEAFGHGTGHGIGLEIHEEPRISRARPDVSPTTLRSGMVMTIEPGAYIPGFGGVRIEDDVLVIDEGCHILTNVTRELLALE
jgi:Xaa-Pro aminopeptidase